MNTRVGSRISGTALRFRFDGRELTAQTGDTVASALLANGVKLLGRSVKYRRPRGLLSADLTEPNALVTVGPSSCFIPNLPAPCVRVRDALAVRSQNRWPTLSWDIASLLRLGGGFFGAGFYYKTFLWPSWDAYEPLIRRLAGYGKAPAASDLPTIVTQHLECDVVVAGAGAAGLMAALSAARSGAHVILTERDVACGGELDFENATIDGLTGSAWISRVLSELATLRVQIFTETTVVADDGEQVLAVRQSGGIPGADTLMRIHASAFIRATGAAEQPIAFINNDLPGILLAGAGECYLARYGVHVGRRVLLFGNHDRLYRTAARLLEANMQVLAIVDTRVSPTIPEAIAERLQRHGVACLQGCAVSAAHGRAAVRAASIVSLASGQTVRRFDCDALLVSGGWEANLPVSSTPRTLQCGAAAGLLELAAVLNDAAKCGVDAARLSGHSGVISPPTAKGDPEPRVKIFLAAPASEQEEKLQFVDLQNDVTVADLRQSLQEGFLHIEHIKRYTGLGIGTEQGATSSVLGARIVANLRSSAEPARTTRRRLPFHPLTTAAVSSRIGMNLSPVRRTALHEQHVRHGAVMESMGLWMRPRYYSANGSDALQAGIVEARRVRQQGGLMDASTLGKIEINGRDAAAFLDSVYLTRASTLRVGRSKFMVNLREDGMVLDDGIVMRLAENRFVATVSSGHADHMAAHFDFWRDRRHSGREVAITDVTEAWSIIAVAGPDARNKLTAVLGDTWRETLQTLTHMGVTEGEWHGQLRVLRASFSGELAYEVHCRPPQATFLWQALVESGLQPYGIEAVDILRVEKGYLSAAEINGQTTPGDLGMTAMLNANPGCVGRELLDRPALLAPDRPCLVGLRVCDGQSRFLAGAQITLRDEKVRSCGYVTAAVFSPALNEWLGLGLVSRRWCQPGTLLLARDPVRSLETQIVVAPLVNFDPQGQRMKT